MLPTSVGYVGGKSNFLLFATGWLALLIPSQIQPSDWQGIVAHKRANIGALPTVGRRESGALIAGAYLVYSVITDLAIWGRGLLLATGAFDEKIVPT